MLKIPKAVLVDARTWPFLKEPLLLAIADAKTKGILNGFDIETNDARRHEGLNRAMKVDDEGFKSATSKLIFDTNRTDVTGFSFYIDGDDYAYYVNLAHADVENRLPWPEARLLIDTMGMKVAHNAPYELTMMRKSLGYEIREGDIICTMQMAVSAWNDDTYNVNEFLEPGLRGIAKLVPQIRQLFYGFQPGMELSNEQDEMLMKVIAKESDAAHSYNGFVKEIAYSYGLKRLAKKLLNYDQTSFDEVLNGKAHMGQLTGDEVVAYGCDDAWVCVALYHKILEYMMKTNPRVVPVFFQQENPMIHIYSQVWGDGVKIDLDSVYRHRGLERSGYAETLRKMKESVKALLPFPPEPHEKLVKYDSKYKPDKYRGDVVRWASLPDSDDDFVQAYQVRGSVSKAWAADLSKAESKGISIVYYLVMRCILYDLCGCSFQLLDGKVQSDKDARDVMRKRWIKKHLDAEVIEFTKEDSEKQEHPQRGPKADDESWHRFFHTLNILDCYKQLAGIDQTIKLFINTYLNLTDPETGRVYPVLNSLLNTRRMALAVPNLSQLPKFGGTAYVRSFFQPDEPDHVLLSIDWSSVELVLIGDASGDPEFAKVFGQIPFGDLHTGTAADLLKLTVEAFKALDDAKKLRTDVGKGANFNYWYSGALGTVARELGMTSEEMWEAVDRYRTRFWQAEEWRLGTIQEARTYGYVTLPDGHQRIRYESTPMWAEQMKAKFAQYGEEAARFGELVVKKIQTRSGNQAVNAKIQGTGGTLAKRSILRIRKELIKSCKYRARFAFPVHDELVFSVHKDDAYNFMIEARHIMCDHKDIVTRLMLDAAPSIGLNYQPYDKATNPKGQIEIAELSKLPFIKEERWGQFATKEEFDQILDYLFSTEKARADATAAT